MSPLFVAESVLLHGEPSAPAAGAAASGPVAGGPAPATPTATSTVTSTVTSAAAPVATAPPAPAEGAAAGVVAEVTTAGYSATMPVGLAIPAIALEAQVAPMGWEAVMAGDQVTTRWVVPEQTLGWAVNSAGAGEPGNVIIAGHQAVGAGLFRPLAVGEIAVGDDIQLRGADGTTYLYRVSEVSDPIIALGASPAEQADAAAYLAPTTEARLTLVTGWPADTTTHRLFVVALYAGAQP